MAEKPNCHRGESEVMEGWTTQPVWDPSIDSQARTGCSQQQAAVMRYLEEKVLPELEVKEQSSAIFLSFISRLDDREWQSIQDRMRQPLSQSQLAKVSKRIIRMVSQMVLQLLVHLLEDEPKEVGSKEEPKRDDRKSCSLLGDHLQEYSENLKETLAPLLAISASFHCSVGSMLGDVVMQLNQGLYVLASQSQERSEVTLAAVKLMALAGETLADLTEEEADQDKDAVIESATEEVMFAIAENVTSYQGRDVKSGVLLRALAAKISEQQRSSQMVMVDLEEEEMPDFEDELEQFARFKSDIHVRTYPVLVFPEKVSKDLSKSRDSCLQVLKVLLTKFLAWCSPQSFSLMLSPDRSSLPTLETVSSNMLDIVVDAVKDICQREKSQFLLQQHKVHEEQIETSATAIKVALKEELQEFLNAAEEAKKDKMEEIKKTVSSLLSDMRDKTVEECDDDQKEKLLKVQTVKALLEKLGQRHNLPSVFQLLKSPASFGPISPSEKVLWFSEAAVKHLLTLHLLHPLSWRLGCAIQVMSSPSAARRFRDTTQLYDDIISLYVRMMCDQVMNCLSRSSAAFRLQLEVESFLDKLETDSSAPEKRTNIVHFFQKLPKKIRSKWSTVTTRRDIYSRLSEDSESASRSEDDEGGVDVSEDDQSI